ncbi:hypothetical protein [Acetobacter okinawensis]|uniref:hypothetical protein n=1 Tax=Acetobacter okinawensis TaxID=1076594 RepID=UPI000471D084|nr:hypothetical protein [Acetobacter okinawensis]
MPPTLRFRTPGNERVVLDQAATKASISHVKECLLALSFLQGKLEACQTNGGVDVLLDDISPALGVMEHKWTALVELLSVPSAIARNVAERSAALREANMKIRLLEEKLGGEITGEQVQCALYNASNALQRWWKENGFAHISSITFGEYACTVELSLSIPEFSPWEDAEDRGQIAPGQAMILWAQSVQQHGFVLMSEDHGRDRYVVDCDASSAAVEKIIKTGLPSAQIRERKTVRRGHDPRLCLNGVTIFIRSIEDIWMLMSKQEQTANSPAAGEGNGA